MNSKERYERVMAAILEQELERALNGNVFVVQDRSVKSLPVKELPIKDLTLGEIINDLLNRISTLELAYNDLVDVVNSNQEATTAAIDAVRKDLETGKAF